MIQVNQHPIDVQECPGWATTRDVTGADYRAQIIDSSWQAVRPAVQGRELMEIAIVKQKTDLPRRANNLALVVDR